MAYTNCGACGAKALVGATRCPRCQTPFVSYDVKGERVPTVNCPVCGVQRPTAIGACPNCLTSTKGSSRVRLTRGLLRPGVAIAAILAVGYAVSRAREEIPTVVAPRVATGSAADSTRAHASGAAGAPDSTLREEPLSPAPAAVVADTGRWDDAVATTWVHMRSAPNRGSEVLRTIDSGQRVRLGPPSAGWRSARVGIDRGWVDPRLFKTVPMRRP
jgi:hypothetical protein